MKVKEVIDLLSYGVQWQLIGAMTGKKLCNSKSTNKMKDRYMDLEVHSIFPSFYTQQDHITRTYDFIQPMICIWVSCQ